MRNNLSFELLSYPLPVIPLDQKLLSVGVHQVIHVLSLDQKLGSDNLAQTTQGVVGGSIEEIEPLKSQSGISMGSLLGL
jgi:hypothetical protein